MNARRIIFSTLLFTVILSVANPVVWLHGWNSDGSLWDNLQAQMIQSASASANDFLTLSYYDDGLGFTTDSPIDEVAQAVSREIMNFYEGRNDGMPVDVVAHSMGGLVFRSMIAQECFVDNSILRRYITLGTPHYGQNADLSYQAKQMKYGSDFLWRLGEAWHFDGKRWLGQDTLCIAGITDFYFGQSTKSYGSYWDGLIHAWSASLGGDVPVRYVYRCHSSTLLNAEAPALCSCRDKGKDAVFCLIRDFLDDGSLPERLIPTYGGSNDEQGKMPNWVQNERSMWSLFAQIHSASNCVPFHYTPMDVNGDTINYTVNGAKPEDLCIEYGTDETSGYSNGVFQIFGNLPTDGVHEIVLWKPGKTDSFSPVQPIVPEPGSCRLMRFYDSPNPTLTATAAGQSVSVPLSWLSSTGLVANVESLVDCSNKLAAATTNGYTGAECWYYGVNPWDADDRAWIRATGLTVTNGSVRLGFSGQTVAGDRVHVQRTSTLAGPFADVADSELVREEDAVSILAIQSDTSGFYRLFVR